MKETRNSKNPKRKPFGDPSRNKCRNNKPYLEAKSANSQSVFFIKHKQYICGFYVPMT